MAKTPNCNLGDMSKSEIINFAREINITLKLNHPAILRTIGYSPFGPNNEQKPFILIEYPSDDSLGNIIYSWNRTVKALMNWDDTIKLNVIYGIAVGMSYLHSHNIIHRDLNVNNIHLDSNKLPKIRGFNISKVIIDGEPTKSNKLKGTPAYLAPEVYLKHEYSKMSDVYSFGLLVYEIMTEQKPFESSLNVKYIKHFIADEKKRPQFNKPIPDSYRQLIEKCWSQNPENRPTFEEIVQKLKTDPGFILDKVEKEFFLNYAQYLEKYEISFDTSKNIKELDDLIKISVNKFTDLNTNFNFKLIYQTFYNNISLNFEGLNMDDYDKQNRICEGSFYDVFTVCERKTGILYAYKSIKHVLKCINKNDFINFLRELNIVFQLNHPSFLKYTGYTNQETPGIIVEYAPNGSLDQIQGSQSKKVWNNTKKLINIYGIAIGMSYLHDHNIIHRDLKTKNILIDDKINPKIAGFNISKVITDGEPTKSNKLKGTPAYLAPEVYLKHEYSKMSDVYSFGLLVYEIMTEQKPFESSLNVKYIKHFIADEKKRPQFNKPIPDSYRQLIEKCWSQNPENRPTFEEIVQKLKTDPGFITNDIDQKEYEQYIKFIESTPKSFESSKKIQQLNDIIRLKSQLLKDISINVNLRGIYETEMQNICFDIKMINPTDYLKQNLIAACSNYKLHVYLNKNNQLRYYGQKIIDVDRHKISDVLSIVSNFDHPCINKFIGYSPIDMKERNNPIIITEYASNGSLDKILDAERMNKPIPEWNDTKKLIVIFGLASGMSYLHSQNIIYYSLTPNNIFINEFFFPKIDNFYELKVLYENKRIFYSENLPTVYCPPEFFKSPFINSKSGDVYTFSLIMYEILTNEIPYNDIKQDENKTLVDMILKGKRPTFKKKIRECYKKLIEECWSQEPEKRPTFDKIIKELKTNSDFLTETINKREFFEFVEFVENRNNFKFHKFNIELPKINKKQQFLVNMNQTDLNSFNKKARIGKGGFGSVYKVVERLTEKIYAAKVSIYELDQCTDDIIKNLAREVEITSKLNHPAIIKFIGYSSNNFKHNPKPTIITEFAKNGSLDKIIELERLNCSISDWNDTKKLICIYGIAAGMKYLIENRFIHRDLKPANIFLDEFLYPKIGDFGLSKRENDYSYSYDIGNAKKSGFKGTFAYCSPEIIKYNKYSEKSDVYAFGMIVYEIMTTELPFKNLNRYQVIVEILKGFTPTYKYPIPHCYKKLIEKCLSHDEKKRPIFYKIVKTIEDNTEFITSNVDKEEFLNYVSFLKKSLGGKTLETLDISSDFKPNSSFHDASVETEETEYSEYSGFLDLSRFKPLCIIAKGEISKVYKVKEKSTGNLYAAKVSMIKIDKFSRDEAISLQREVNIISQLNHPSFLKFIGYSPKDFKKEMKPVIVTEFSCVGSLEQILENERRGIIISGWDDTRKLINIFGIASGMSYLHSHGIIHRNLKPETVFVDGYLFPKIGDFGLSTKFNNPDSITFQSTTGMIGNPVYCSPEVLEANEYSKASDVYAFAFIVFELITTDIPFENYDVNNIFTEIVIKRNRPELNNNVSKIYKELIERCWSHDPKDRPTFEQIISNLKTNELFITENVNQKDFKKYIQLIDEYITTFETNKKIFQLDDFIHSKSRIVEDDLELDQIIQKLIQSNDAKKLMLFLNEKCDNDTTLLVFDKCNLESKELYFNLCHEGIVINNSVALYKTAISLIFTDKVSMKNLKAARNYLQKSIEKGFVPSYFLYARLCYEIFNENKTAFESAKIGSEKGDKYSQFLFGFFIANGIGTKKDFENGISIILLSGAEDCYNLYATSIGIYYLTIKKDPNKAFIWFEKAFHLKKTKATINNYGICFLNGIGCNKDIEKAKEIFNIGVKKNDSNSLYHLAYILEKTDHENSMKLYKEAACQGHVHAQSRYAVLISEINYNTS